MRSLKYAFNQCTIRDPVATSITGLLLSSLINEQIGEVDYLTALVPAQISVRRFCFDVLFSKEEETFFTSVRRVLKR